jgi:site-specific DNA recombinase
MNMSANFGMTNELRGVEKKSGESISTFSASVPRPAFEIIKVGKMWVKRKMQRNTAI